MSVTPSCPILQVLLLSQNQATEGTPEATAPATMAEETATALMEGQTAVDMVLPSTMQAGQTRTPPLTQETSAPSTPAPLSALRPITVGFFMGQHRGSA